MRMLIGAIIIGGLIAWVVSLQRRLQAAQMRGDMYRDVAARLDQRVADLGG